MLQVGLRSRLDRAILSYGCGAGPGSYPKAPAQPRGGEGAGAQEGIVVSPCISQNGLMGQTEAHLIGK